MTPPRKSPAQLVCPRCIAIEALDEIERVPAKDSGAIAIRYVTAKTALQQIATDNGHAPLCPEHERASKGEG